MNDREKIVELRDRIRQQCVQVKMIYEDSVDLVPIGDEWVTFIDGIEIKELTIDDFKHSTLAVVHGREGSTIPRHYHIHKELIHVIHGEHVETVSGEILKAGEFIEIESYQKHGSKFLQDTILIIQWIPKIEKL